MSLNKVIAIAFVAAVVLVFTGWLMRGCHDNGRVSEVSAQQAKVAPVPAAPETVKVKVEVPKLFPLVRESSGKYSFASTGYLLVEKENDGIALYLSPAPDPDRMLGLEKRVYYGMITTVTVITTNRHGMADPRKLLPDYDGRMVTISGHSRGVRPYPGEGGTHYEDVRVRDVAINFHDLRDQYDLGRGSYH